MEIHDTDPTTDAGDDPWNEVNARFVELGRRMKSTYRKVAGDLGPSEDEIEGAFSTLIGAWDQVAESITAILRDPDTRDDLKMAASSLAGALGSTLTHLGVEFGADPGRAGNEEEE